MFDRGVYAITPSGWPTEQLLFALELALKAGVSVVQYREKGMEKAEKLDVARQIIELTRSFGVPCIVNDDVELARLVGADGVHIGRDDGDVREVRQYMGASVIIGVSCYGDLMRMVTATEGEANYVAYGSVFASLTKPLAPSLGVDGLKCLCQKTSLPCVAIGGITAENVQSVYACGVHAVSAISSIFVSLDITRAVEQLKPFL